VLLKNISVIGAPLDIRFKMEPDTMHAAVAEIFAMYGRGEVKPEIMRTYPLERIHEAMEVIVGRQVKGKIVLTTAAA
jgi:NADPH2:quinone reductase